MRGCARQAMRTPHRSQRSTAGRTFGVVLLDSPDPGRQAARLLDLAVMTRLAMRERRITSLTRRSQAAFRFPIKGRKLYLSGHNPLIRAGYPGAIGLKTGYTDAAGRCFVGVARRAGRTFGVVLLDSPDPGRQAARLLDLAFEFG